MTYFILLNVSSVSFHVTFASDYWDNSPLWIDRIAKRTIKFKLVILNMLYKSPQESYFKRSLFSSWQIPLPWETSFELKTISLNILYIELPHNQILLIKHEGEPISSWPFEFLFFCNLEGLTGPANNPLSNFKQVASFRLYLTDIEKNQPLKLWQKSKKVNLLCSSSVNLYDICE